jgi:hypothetical protein
MRPDRVRAAAQHPLHRAGRACGRADLDQASQLKDAVLLDYVCFFFEGQMSSMVAGSFGMHFRDGDFASRATLTSNAETGGG